jgi:acetyl esterase/lipase
MGVVFSAGRTSGLVWLAAAACLTCVPAVHAQNTYTLKNGMILEGIHDSIPSMGGDLLAAAGKGDVKPKRILIVDNQLTRIFVLAGQVVKEAPSPAISSERIKINQKVATSGQRIGNVGGGRADPFDEHGRRTFWMGNIPIVQGITEITPKWTKLEAIQGSKNYILTQKVATSSIPREQLSRVLYHVLDPKNSDDRLRIVRLYLQAENFQWARQELDQVLKDFPELAALQEQLKTLRQMNAQRLFREIDLRQNSGQYALATTMLKGFPAEGVAGETLLQVKDALESFNKLQLLSNRARTMLTQHLAAVKEDAVRQGATPVVKEIQRELNFNTLDRMADYLRLANDATSTPEQKLSLAISGWLLGSGAGSENLATSVSLVKVRDQVQKYLAANRKPDLENILANLTSLEGATPPNISALIAHMKPPLETTIAAAPGVDVGKPADVLGLPTDPAAKSEKGKAGDAKPAEAKPNDAKKPAPAAPTATCDEPAVAANVSAKLEPPQPNTAQATNIPGLLEFDVKSPLPEEPVVHYSVQLPPEYDPYRRYPCIVTLNGGRTPQQQIDWWAGDFEPKTASRYGQATRYGYIVIAPRWLREHQWKYEYSAREHQAVLLSLRDACKRLSIDVDRVFLSGHSIGGDAAWDIGLAHPDLWAGMIPIVAVADKYVKHSYRENGKYLPMYFVCGERDGNKLSLNADEWDHYLLKDNAYDVMIVQYQGRGHEDFHDEILNIFAWMNLHKRNFFPKKFTVYSLRPSDKFFWWVETDKPLEANVILPVEWGSKKALAAKTEGTINPTNGVSVDRGTGKVTVWLSPEMVSFDKPVTVSIENRKTTNVQPSVPTLLEDVRTRGDRQHPFWAKVEPENTGKRGASAQ